MATDEEIAVFVNSISSKYPALRNCWGAVDGLKLCLEKSGDNKMQSIFFNCWTHNHYVCNLFLFSPDVKIRACYINCPGSMHDSTMANWGGIYKKLDDLYEATGAKVVVDSAFALENCQSLYKSCQSNIDNCGYVRQNLEVQRQAASVRQMAEWGMRGLQASFPRLKDRLIYEEKGYQQLILQLIISLQLLGISSRFKPDAILAHALAST
jgi:DDE superfamily endonuclease